MCCALREIRQFFSVSRRIAILTTVFAMFEELSLKQVKNRLQSFASKPDDSWLPCVFKAAFLTTDAVIFSKTAGWYGNDSNLMSSNMLLSLTWEGVRFSR